MGGVKSTRPRCCKSPSPISLNQVAETFFAIHAFRVDTFLWIHTSTHLRLQSPGGCPFVRCLKSCQGGGTGDWPCLEPFLNYFKLGENTFHFGSSVTLKKVGELNYFLWLPKSQHIFTINGIQSSDNKSSQVAQLNTEWLLIHCLKIPIFIYFVVSPNFSLKCFCNFSLNWKQIHKTKIQQSKCRTFEVQEKNCGVRRGADVIYKHCHSCLHSRCTFPGRFIPHKATGSEDISL